MTRVLEVCVDNYDSALSAFAGGAGRLELCSSLESGGLTPTPGLLKQIQAVNSNGVTVFCMLRCRASNFVYTDDELKIMVNDAKILKLNGADGFVFGALTENGDVDLRKCREIIKTCYPLPVTFHRAFDLVKHPHIQLESVIDVGFQRLLTSGTKKTALDGCEIIRQLIKRANNRIVIIPGGGINKNNIKEIMDETRAREYHGSFQKLHPVKEDTNKINNGKEEQPIPDKVEDIFEVGSLILTDSAHISEVVQILKL